MNAQPRWQMHPCKDSGESNSKRRGKWRLFARGCCFLHKHSFSFVMHVCAARVSCAQADPFSLAGYIRTLMGIFWRRRCCP